MSQPHVANYYAANGVQVTFVSPPTHVEGRVGHQRAPRLAVVDGRSAGRDLAGLYAGLYAGATLLRERERGDLLLQSGIGRLDQYGPIREDDGWHAL